MDGRRMEVEDMMKFGIFMSKFHSDPLVNTMICAAIVAGMAFLASTVERVQEPVKKAAKKALAALGWPQTYTHTIEAVEMKDLWSGVIIENPGAPRNRILLKAIRMYMTEKRIGLSQNGAVLELHHKKILKKDRRGNDDDQEHEAKKAADAEYAIHSLPPLSQDEDAHPRWITVAPCVEFVHYEVDVPKVKGTKFTYRFRSHAHDGNDRIHAFIKQCFVWYKAHVKETESEAKGIYLYLQHLSIGAGKPTNQPVVWKRFRLANKKNFEAFFHPERQNLLRLVGNFLNKTDKFSKAGFPDKLGLLLYGPPGTGKTTLIKCLAKYTNRNIVNINLARVKTNQELMEIMYSQRFNVMGEDDHVSLQHNQVIFVLEDVDAASNVVLKREGLGRTGATTAIKHEKEEKEDAPVENLLKFLLTSSTKKPETSDRLNLSGVLNALDGVVETPGRMVVMTTNFRGSLDPALIRPGRINKEIKLDYIKRDEAREMIRYYYDTDPPQHLIDTFSEERFTPAELEQFCSEHSSVEALFKKLKVVISVQPRR